MQFLTQEQFNKLSQVARREIEFLERRLEDMNTRNAELVAALPVEGVRAQFKSSPDKLVVDTFAHRLVFPQDKSVEFGLGGMNYINIRFENGRLLVRGNSSLRIQPESGNGLIMWVER